MQSDLLALVVGLLDEAGIPHMLAGSFASTYHGEPRMTRDIDLVIDHTTEAIREFVDRLDRDRFYIGDAVGAVQGRDMFNIVDTASGWKVDLIVRKERPFSIEEFRRRVPATIEGVDVFVATAEDTVLAKLEWARQSGSERQLGDVLAVARAQPLDRDYLTRWARELGVEADLDRVLSEAAD